MALPVEGGASTKVYTAPGTTASSSVPPTPVTAPTASAPPGTAPIPGAAVYGMRQADAQKAYDTSIQQLQDRQNRLYSEFGFLNDGTVDPNAKYGRYQMMQGQQATESDAALYASHGRGFTGGLVNADLENVELGHGAQRFGMQASLANSIADINAARSAAAQTRGESMTNAEQEQLLAALQAQQFTPAAPVDAAAVSAPAAIAKATTTRTPAVVRRSATTTARRNLVNYVTGRR